MKEVHTAHRAPEIKQAQLIANSKTITATTVDKITDTCCLCSTGETPEAMLVKDADKLDMITQVMR